VANMEKQTLVYKGKTKNVYTTTDDGFYVYEFKSGEDGHDDGVAACKNKISALCFETLERNGVATHFVKIVGEREMLVRRLTLLPIDIFCSNIAAGETSKKMKLPEGEALPFPVARFRLRNDALNNPNMNFDHIKIATNVTEGEVKIVQAKIKEINWVLKSFFNERDISLVDIMMEFGRSDDGMTRLGGEITPDTCRLWDRQAYEKIDKDRFLRDMGADEAGCLEVLRRLSGK
jgi:phosphoribosylaminoimidazole-succinocarboxamide synthase